MKKIEMLREKFISIKNFFEFYRSKENEIHSFFERIMLSFALCFVGWFAVCLWVINIIITALMINAVDFVNPFIVWILTSVGQVFLIYGLITFFLSLSNYKRYKLRHT